MADELVSTARDTAEEIFQVVSLQALLASKQRRKLGELSESVTHLAAILHQYYVDGGIPDDTGLPWSRRALDEAIRNGPHV